MWVCVYVHLTLQCIQPARRPMPDLLTHSHQPSLHSLHMCTVCEITSKCCYSIILTKHWLFGHCIIFPLVYFLSVMSDWFDYLYLFRYFLSDRVVQIGVPCTQVYPFPLLSSHASLSPRSCHFPPLSFPFFSFHLPFLSLHPVIPATPSSFHLSLSMLTLHALSLPSFCLLSCFHPSPLILPVSSHPAFRSSFHPFPPLSVYLL